MLKTFQKSAKIIQGNLVIFLLFSIVAGVAFGWAYPAAKELKSYTTLVLFIMLYPMMIGLRIEEVGKERMKSRNSCG